MTRPTVLILRNGQTLVVKPTSWSYAGTVGAWIATVDGGPRNELPKRQGVVADVVTEASRALGEIHRPRHVSIEWAEIDESGQEIAFHDDDETDVESWDDVLRCIRRLQRAGACGAIESLFVDLDTEVQLESGPSWLEGSAELQLSSGEAADSSRMTIAVTYATRVDIWLSENTSTRELGLDNRTLADCNRPRLVGTLQRLAASLGAPLSVSTSDRYLNEITPTGFRPDPGGFRGQD